MLLIVFARQHQRAQVRKGLILFCDRHKRFNCLISAVPSEILHEQIIEVVGATKTLLGM